MQRYHGFDDRDDLAAEFEEGTGNRWDKSFVPAADFPTDEQIIYACYEHEDYDGRAWVLFHKDGQLFEVDGGHCSCYGLEGQWEPEATSWKALALRFKDRDNYRYPATDELKQLIQVQAEQEA
jgi:hypothetical protein